MICIDIGVYPPAPWGHQAARSIVANHCSPVLVSLSSHCSPVLLSLSSLLSPFCQSGILYGCLQVSKLGLVTVYWTPGTGVNPNLTVLPRFVMVPGGSLKSIKFQPVSRTLPNHQSVTPSTQKPPKMRSQDVPEHPRIANQPKKWNLTKP